MCCHFIIIAIVHNVCIFGLQNLGANGMFSSDKDKRKNFSFSRHFPFMKSRDIGGGGDDVSADESKMFTIFGILIVMGVGVCLVTVFCLMVLVFAIVIG